ncbi:MAG: ribonuclease R [Actinobacteria bacterium]|nr:ribonuclease R [Actinomycetota bacterium]
MSTKKDSLAEELIIQTLKELKKPASISKIKRFLKGSGLTESRIEKSLKSLVSEGKVIFVEGKYSIIREQQTIIGHFDEARKGYGFVIHPKGDVFIPIRLKGGAMDGDLVEAIITGFRKGKREGKIISVLERKNEKLVGLVERKGLVSYLIPADKRIRRPIVLTGVDDLEQGTVVEALIKVYPKSFDDVIYAEVSKVLGREDEKGIDIEILIRMHGLPQSFPSEVEEEAKRVARFPSEIPSNRRDLRNLFTVTIDGLDAKDFDDAVSLKKEGDFYRLWVHIADVSYYVKPNSFLDKEAFKRSFSVYLVDRVIPMLPFELSAGICSLKPNEDRLSMTVEMLIDKSGKVIEKDFYESVICSDYRLTYEEVDECIESGKFKNQDIERLITELLELKDILEKKRLKRGSLNFEIPEPKVILDEEGNPIDVIIREKTPATSIIEEAMIVANETVAQYFMENDYPTIFRIHEKPDQNDVEFVKRFLAELGYASYKGLKASPKSFQKVILESDKRDDRVLVNILLLRSLKKARYSSEPLGHFGLATSTYLHFTSPIRRYPDLIVHRQLKTLLKNGSRKPKGIQEELERIAEHCSAREIEVDAAERDSQELKLYQLMKEKYVGEVFEGIISGVVAGGLYVELPNTAEGYVDLTEISDKLELNQDKYEIYDRKSGQVFRVGEKVLVQILNVSVAERFMKLMLV